MGQMDIVIDASAIIAIVANEPEKASLIELTVGADLIAPASIHYEIGNAFSAMLKRQRITLSQVTTALRLCQSIPIRYVNVDLPAAMRIASELDLYAYDAYLLHCAEKYRSPLLTLDRKLGANAEAYGVTIIEGSR